MSHENDHLVDLLLYSNPILPKKMETVESVEICIWLVVSKIFYSEGRIMGGEGVHIVETRMFCTVCLKSSCLLICFHSWSLDLSQTLIQTIQILKEEKTVPKPIEKQKKQKKTKKHKKKQKNKKVSPHVTCPASPQTLSMGRNFLFLLFFLVFSRFFQQGSAFKAKYR